MKKILCGAWIALASFGLVVALTACATEAGYTFGDGTHHNPAVIIPAEYAQIEEAKAIVDNGASASVLLTAGSSNAAANVSTDLLVHFRITATGTKPFHLDPAAIVCGYGTLANFKSPAFTPVNVEDKVLLDAKHPPLVAVTLKPGEATEGWVSYKVAHTDGSVLMEWRSAAPGSKDVLAVWEDVFSLNK